MKVTNSWRSRKTLLNYFHKLLSRKDPSGHNLENLKSVRYWPKRALFLKKRAPKISPSSIQSFFNHPLLNSFPYSMFCIKIKLCIISTKAAASEGRIHKRSRIGPVHVNYDLHFLVLLAHVKICLTFPFFVARELRIIFETCSV